MRYKKLPLILQSEMAECGLACLNMILGFYNCKTSLSQIRRNDRSSLKGITLQQLTKIAEKYNLSVSTLRIEVDQLSTLRLPCIVHWEMNHFMVIKQIRGEKIIVHDPAQGIRTIAIEQFKQSFTGIALEIFPNSDFEPSTPEKKQSDGVMISLLKKHFLTISKLIFISGLVQLFYVLGIKFVQNCIDVSIDSPQFHLLPLLLIAFLGIKLMEVCAIAIRSLIVTYVGTLINYEFGVVVMRHLLTLPTYFFENRHVGDVLSRFSAIEKIKSTLTEGLIEGLIDGMVSIITLVAMCFYSIKITIIVIITSAIYLLSRLYYNAKARQYHEESLHARSTELSHFMETIRAIPPIKIFSKSEDRLEGWSTRFIRSLNAVTRLSWHKITYDSVKDLLYSLDLILVLFLGCALIANQLLTLGMLYAFLAYRQQFIMAIGSLVDKMQDYKLLRLHLDRLNDIISEPSELKIQEKPCLHANNFSQGILSIKNVSFSYSTDEKPVLNKINFVIHQGECIAITGPSGCGKTTLLKILMGLLRPTQGQVLINKTSIYPNHVACFRKHISGVLQEDVLLSGTIKENISFFDPMKNADKVYQCAQLAGIIDEIHALPMGFDTLIGDMGSVLSGGQKQRVLLARALYAEPSILFLDEASSHLDSKNESFINKAIRSLGITVVLIAHRKETILMADRIIELEKLHSPPENFKSEIIKTHNNRIKEVNFDKKTRKAIYL